jgi:hypothetical protein
MKDLLQMPSQEILISTWSTNVMTLNRDSFIHYFVFAEPSLNHFGCWRARLIHSIHSIHSLAMN